MSKLQEQNTKTISTVECGLFGIQQDFAQDYLSLDNKFIPNKTSTFFFKASGESMAPLIMPGDILIVDRSYSFISGQICILNLDGQLICKKLYERAHGLVLKSLNPDHQDIHITPERDFSIFGVVTALARNLKELKDI